MKEHIAIAEPRKSPAAESDVRAAWNSLMAAYDAAKAADDDINARYDAAASVYEAEKPAEPEIDVALLFGFFLGRCDVARRRLLYSVDLDELQHQILAAEGVTRWERVDRDPQRIAELDKVREYRRLLEECDERHRLTALGDEWAEAGKRLADARNALVLATAPDLSAVRWKLDQLFGPEVTQSVDDEPRGIPCWDAELTDAVIADMARLGGAA